ncbi:hypothetical protein BKA58DRAFT_441872 [Alternaria rosae]|uniref:uncharacterized protein n=1 Tax=Alternaria rosae TaxID=1187941 RepID=UPI001E8D3F92|nr:uncharacterized protein BKA58DRAFT_441872 [Alternaria rosae]KAH6866877.1 hypothetical protein BKA58DRAFT_441872 [Alternaria rosae]
MGSFDWQEKGQYKVNENTKTKAKKFSRYQVYEYVKKHNKSSRGEVEILVEEEKDRINKTRATLKSYQSVEFAGGGDYEDFFDCPSW